MLLHPAKVDELLVCPRGNAVYSMTLSGTVTQTWSSGRSEEAAHFVAAAVAPKGTYLYCLGGDGTLYCFNVSEGRLEHLLTCHDGDAAIGVAHHPHRNLLATFADASELKCWKAG